MSSTDTEATRDEDLQELVYTNRWLIQNRWGVEEHQAYAERLADQLVAFATGGTVEPVPVTEPEAAASRLEPPAGFTPPEWQVTGSTFPIVGRRFTPAEFVTYVKWVKANERYSWEPSGITVHHTGVPDLSMRPNGFKEQHMLSLRNYYHRDLGWRSGPHVFTDDHGIWVLTPLSTKGIHARSFNSTRYGIEMLGNFDTLQDYNDSRGIASRKNGKIAAAVLMKYAGISTGKLNFHRHDRLTNKTCPGEHVDFAAFEEDVLETVEAI